MSKFLAYVVAIALFVAAVASLTYAGHVWVAGNIAQAICLVVIWFVCAVSSGVTWSIASGK